MFMRAIILLGFCCIPHLACERLNNKLDQVALTCGEDALSYGEARFVRLAEDLNADDWQGVVSTPQGFEILTRSSRGCLIAPKGLDGAIYVRHKSSQLGAAFTSRELAVDAVSYLPVSSEAPQLAAKLVNIDCGDAYSAGLTASYRTRSQASTQLHHYAITYELYSKGPTRVRLHQSVLSLDDQSFDLPAFLQDGSYLLSYTMRDAFEESKAQGDVGAQTIECPLVLDRKAPAFLGITETLQPLADASTLEVAPGQAVNLKVTDELSEFQVYLCSAAEGETPCEDFSPLNGPYYAPEQGYRSIRFYLSDRAGNRSPIQSLPTLAVVHRDVMQNVEAELLLARNESDQYHKIEANLHWLKAHQLYSNLKLPIERDALGIKIGLTYSEIAKNQSNRGRFFDHRAEISQLVSVPARSPRPAFFASLDRSGFLSLRTFEGERVSSKEEVRAVEVHPQLGLLILYRDASLQIGIDGPRLSFTQGFAPTAMKMDPQTLSLLAWDQGAIGAFQLSAEGINSLLQTNLDFVPEKAASDGTHLLVGGSKKVVLLALDGGQVLAEQSWDRRCRLGELTASQNAEWFISLRYDYKEAEGEFQCNLFSWNGKGPWQEVLPSEVYNPEDIDGKPGDFKFADLKDVLFIPSKGWLLLSRDGFDSTLGFLDLKTRLMRFIRPQISLNENSGATTALSLSADGNFLADSSYTPKRPGTIDQIETRLWDLRRADDANFDADQVLIRRTVEPSLEATHLAIDGIGGRIVSSVRGRELRMASTINLLAPAYPSEIYPAFSRFAESDLLLLNGTLIERRNRFGELLLTLPSPGRVVALTLDSKGALVALDREGKLWEAEPETYTWKKVFDSGLAIEKPGENLQAYDLVLMPSPRRDKLLLVGWDAASQGESLIVEQGQDGRWTEGAKFGVASQCAAWNTDGTLLSLVDDENARLVRVDGRVLTQRPLSGGALSCTRALPFSDDGSRWVFAQGSTLEIFDVAQNDYVGKPIEWPHALDYVRFKSASSEALWIVSGEAVLEIDLKGTVRRDLGLIEDAVDTMFERLDSVWVLDRNARLLKLNESSEKPSLLISTEFDKGSSLVGLSESEDFLLQLSDTPSGIPAFNVLFLKDDPQLLTTMCRWMKPLLQAEQSSDIAEARAYCDRENR